MADLTKETIDVEVGAEKFVFRIPTPREHARVSARAHEMRQQDAPRTGGSGYGLDPFAQDLYRGMALMEVLLKQADAKDNWPFQNDANGKPVVNSDKFPPQAIPVIPAIAEGFDIEFARFLKGGAGDGIPVGEAPMGDKPGDA